MDELPLVLKLPEQANLMLPAPEIINFYNNLNDRTYWLTSEVDESLLELAQYIVQWNKEDELLPVESRKPIRLVINSPGGSIDVEETIVSFIKASKTPIYGIAIGCVASAATLIYLSCDKKFALTNSYLILHRGSVQNVSGNYSEVQNAMEDYKFQIQQLEEFYVKHTEIPKEVIKEKLGSDWYIRGEELIQYGLVDEWITDLDVFL